MKKAVIYKIINLVNGKFYVDSTNNQRERFRTHRNKLRSSSHHCAHLQAAWNKYGEDSFIFKVIEEIENEALLQAAEDTWLSEWVGNDRCYNHGLRSGAPWRGVVKELHPSFGRIMSDETKVKISDAQRGVKKAPRVYTEEGLLKVQETMRRNARPQEHTPLDEVIAKFPEEVRSKYDFTNAIYTGALNRITGCVCSIHGEFSQYAAQFRKGSGCAECGALIRNEKKRIEMKLKWSTEEGRKKMGR